MYMVKERENRSKTLGEGWGTISSTSPHAKRRILGGFGWAAAGGGALEGVQLGHKEGKKGRVGEKRLLRAQDIDPVALAHMVRQALSRHCMWRDRVGHLTAHMAQVRNSLPTWRFCRASRSGATEAICRTSADGAAKRTTQRK